MTPQEKAEQLIEKYKNINNVIFTLIKDKPVIWIAKTCALIAVDEILESYKTKDLIYPKEVIYWQEVKQEIKKL